MASNKTYEPLETAICKEITKLPTQSPRTRITRMKIRYVAQVLLLLTLAALSPPLQAQTAKLVRDPYNTANGFLRAGDFAAAVSTYGEAIQANPNNVYAYYGRGLAHGASGKPNEAIADYTEAIRRDAKCVLAYQARAKALLARRDLDKAIADRDTAIQLSPNSIAAYACRAVAYENKGYYSKAIVDYARLIQLDPKNADWHANRAFGYLKIANVDAAMGGKGKGGSHRI